METVIPQKVRREEMMFEKILVGNDGSDGAKKALRVAIDLAKHYPAELYSISVEEDLPHYAATVGEVLEAKEEKNGYFKKINEEAKEMAAKEGVVLHTKVFPGHEVETIVDYAKEHHFDLVVIGFMGHSRVYDRVWGSTSQTLTRMVPCTVMVVK
jgi:nucleotide-binding universal stress UspA family protein